MQNIGWQRLQSFFGLILLTWGLGHSFPARGSETVYKIPLVSLPQDRIATDPSWASETFKADVLSFSIGMDRINRSMATILQEQDRDPFGRMAYLALEGIHEFTPNSDYAFGISYWFDGAVETEAVSSYSVDGYRGIDFGLVARGNFAIKTSGGRNPEDFIDTKLLATWFWSFGGAAELDTTTMQQYVKLGMLRNLVSAEDKGQVEDIERKAADLLESALSNVYTFEIGTSTGFENTQSFGRGYYALGPYAGLGLAGWRNFRADEWSETSWLARMNLWDYPAAFVRMITRKGQGFAPRGLAFPTLRMGYGLVVPLGGKGPREKLVGKDSFGRLWLEARYQAEVCGCSALPWPISGPVRSAVEYRLFAEPQANSLVRRNKLDINQFLTARLEFDGGFYISHSRGRLPFDSSYKQIIKIGFVFYR